MSNQIFEIFGASNDAPYRLQTEQYVGESEKKPQTVHLYNVHEVKKTSVRAESENSIKNTIGSPICNIPPSDTNLNPNVKNNKETFEEAFTDVFFEALAEVLLESKREK